MTLMNVVNGQYFQDGHYRATQLTFVLIICIGVKKFVLKWQNFLYGPAAWISCLPRLAIFYFVDLYCTSVNRINVKANSVTEWLHVQLNFLLTHKSRHTVQTIVLIILYNTQNNVQCFLYKVQRLIGFHKPTFSATAGVYVSVVSIAAPSGSVLSAIPLDSSATA